jgi:hypothetical protein
MKKIVLFILVVLSLTSFSVKNSFADKYNLVGKWSGKDTSGNIGTFLFDKEGYATIILKGEAMGGKDFNRNGIKGDMKYEYIQSNDYIDLDLILTTKEPKKATKKMLFLLKIIDENKIKLARSDDDSRPTSFEKDNTIILSRKQ